MPSPSLRVYLVTHAQGHTSGVLVRRASSQGGPPLTAVGASEEDVVAALEERLLSRQARGEDEIERYLWEERFVTAEVSIDVHPETFEGKRVLIGARVIPLRLTYVHATLPRGGTLVLLPRFGWSFVLEDLSLAAEVLRGAVGTALVGESARSIYDFRSEGDERVREVRLRARGPQAPGPTPGDDAPVLASVADELVERAARGRLGVLVGDPQELGPLVAGLLREPPPSVVLVGPRGVGKTALVRHLARQLASRSGEKQGAGRRGAVRLWSTSADRILAGMIYLGMWQKRCLDLTRELAHAGDLLHVEALVPLLAPQPDGPSIADLLTPAVQAGEIGLVTECTEDELARAQRRAPALLGALEIVRLAEPSAAEVPALLEQYQARRSGAVTLHPAALQRLTAHLAALTKDVAFPGKGFRFLDALEREPAGPRALYPSDVSRAFARFTGLPLEIVSDDAPVSVAALTARLTRSVVGQDRACAACARVVARLKANMNNPERPAGTLLFVGPTGVGKTELAKELARFVFGGEDRLIRLDMSELAFPGSAARLLASEPGRRSLADQVRAQPLSLVLLDEIEKAHPEVFDVLLSILGEGRLTNTYGRTVDFRMVIVIMTSNLGARESAPAGFSPRLAGEPAARPRDAIRAHFRPELVARIDDVIEFAPLSPAHVRAIVDLELEKVGQREGLLRKDLRLELHPDVRARLAELGWHPTRGARPLKRVIEERVVVPVAALLAREPALRGRRIRIVLGPHAGGVDPTGDVVLALGG